MRKLYFFLLLTVLTATFTAEGTIRRVPQDYAKIQLAINAAVNGDTILVSEGTYIENLVINKKIVLGSLFIIDGDTTHISRTVIDGGSPTNPDSASVINIGTGSDISTTIAGLTLTKGNGTRFFFIDGYYYRGGGAINILAGGAKIHHNRIIGNKTMGNTATPFTEGAGINIQNATGPISGYEISDNLFQGNESTGRWCAGGAGCITGNGSILRNRLIDNSALSSAISGPGSIGSAAGAINIISNPSSGAVVLLDGNYFSGNRSTFGSAFGAGSGTTNPAMYPNLTVRNNIVVNNIAIAPDPSHPIQQYGTINFQKCTVQFINNTIANNSNGNFGIRLAQPEQTTRFLNNIIWNPDVGGNQFIFYAGATSNTLYLNNNCIYGGYTGTGNISADPQFVTGDNYYRLMSSSPALGAGTMQATLGGVSLSAPGNDFFGNTRPYPYLSNPDIGAAESPLASPSTATIIRVPQDYPKIQQAINAAGEGNIVLVSEGTYVENLKITKKITLASQYLIDGDTSHISRTIIDGSMPAHPDTGSVIFIGAGTDSTLLITGFTITKGTGNVIIISGSQVCVGGGINIEAGGAAIRNNRIIRNKLTGSTARPYVWGGGIYIWPNMGDLNYWIIEDNLISDNEVSSWGCEGAGLDATGYGRIQRNKFIANRAIAAGITGPEQNYSAGGAIAVGGDTRISYTHITTSDNYFYQNSASWGSAIFAARWNATNLPILKFINNIIVKNVSAAPPSGTFQAWGAIHLHKTESYFINNTIADNTGQYGMYVEQTPHTVRMLNNILWNPSVSLQIRFHLASSVNLLASYNIIKDIYPGTGNLILDPQFAAGDNYYRVMSGSPAIGMGSIQATVGGVSLSAPGYDFFGNPRPNPLGANPDIGAFEHSRATPLPVELTSFTAEATGSTVLIKWATATEINNRGFEIQRKAEGDYFTVGYVGGHGTATIPYNYAYSDKDVPSGSYSYRLKQIDYNGAFEYSPEIEVTVGAETFVLQENYPNPFNPSTIISYQIPIKSKVQLKVLDILGREVATLVNAEQEAGSYKVEFSAARNSIPPLSSGVYFYQLRADPSASSGTVVITRKMLLMK